MIVTQKSSPSCLSFNFLKEFLDKDAFFLLWKRKRSGGRRAAAPRRFLNLSRQHPENNFPFNEDLSGALFNIHLKKN